jgi:hypothetical protein
MEAAAKKVQLLTQRILPERPHHLSISHDKRYRVPSDDDRHIEEWQLRGLQYMTFLSEADRGVLITRPYYDMREEPAAPPTSSNNAQGKMEKKAVTKLSFLDYKKKNKTSSSPPDSGPAIKIEGSSQPTTSESKSNQETRKTESMKSRDIDVSRDDKSHRSRDAPDNERYVGMRLATAAVELTTSPFTNSTSLFI